MANKYDSLVEKLGGRYWAPNQKTVLDEAEFLKVEKITGVPLSEDYKEFIRDYSGIDFEGTSFPIAPNTDIQTERQLGMFYWSGVDEKGRFGDYYSEMTFDTDDMPGVDLVKEMEEGHQQFGWPQELMPIAATPGGTPICLAVSGLRPGAIFLWYINDDYGDNVYLVADSFDEFMQSLHLDE